LYTAYLTVIPRQLKLADQKGKHQINWDWVKLLNQVAFFRPNIDVSILRDGTEVLLWYLMASINESLFDANISWLTNYGTIKITAKNSKVCHPSVKQLIEIMPSCILMQAWKCFWKLKTQRWIISYILIHPRWLATFVSASDHFETLFT